MNAPGLLGGGTIARPELDALGLLDNSEGALSALTGGPGFAALRPLVHLTICTKEVASLGGTGSLQPFGDFCGRAISLEPSRCCSIAL